MKEAIKGIHHITAMASDPQRNLDFYTQVLGQRLVKTTVNFDDPGTYHLYYGDKVGSPGTIMTFFPWPNARRGVPGNGEVTAVAYAISPESVDYWQGRLADLAIDFSIEAPRFGETVIAFKDPDGMTLELITQAGATVPQHWDNGPIPAEHALRGFHGVTIWTAQSEASAQLLTEIFGYSFVGQEDTRLRYKAPSDEVGLFIDLVERPGLPVGRLGAGSVHHIAFRTPDDAEQMAWQQEIADAGFGVTPVRDRQYFNSIYFREPSGVLYEIATDTPGFPADEPVESLGRALKLPPWLESQRVLIEQRLIPLKKREYEHA